jgi:AcrR family transcriptional regulator
MARKILAPQRREQIVEALFHCLSEKGHEKVTVKDIAEQAGLHYGVIHYYFQSKDEIVSALADSIVSRYEHLLLDRVHNVQSASEKIWTSLDFLIDEFIFNRRLNRVFYNLVQMAFENKTVRTALRKQLRAYRGQIADVIEEGIENGEFKRGKKAEIASVMVALIEGMALQWMIEPKALNRDVARKLISDTLGKHLQ